MTGKPYSAFLTAPRKKRDFNIIKVGVNLPREELFDRINRRVDQMMADGLVDEVKSLTGVRETNALKTVGYSELFDYIDGKVSLDEAVERIKTNTRRYAKRQITWFSRDKAMPWFRPDQLNEIIHHCGNAQP